MIALGYIYNVSLNKNKEKRYVEVMLIRIR